MPIVRIAGFLCDLRAVSPNLAVKGFNR